MSVLTIADRVKAGPTLADRIASWDCGGGLERLNKSVGTFDVRAVAAVVNRVERPPELHAGVLGNPEAHELVGPAPDQRNRHSDPSQLVARDPPRGDP